MREVNFGFLIFCESKIVLLASRTSDHLRHSIALDIELNDVQASDWGLLCVQLLSLPVETLISVIVSI